MLLIRRKEYTMRSIWITLFTLWHGLIFLLLALNNSEVKADEIFKCVNPTGVMIYSSSPCPKDVKAISSWTVIPKVPVAQVLQIKSDASGHYVLGGAVNGQVVNFIVDTGASFLSLPSVVAERAGLACEGDVELQTANGMAKGCKVKIALLKFGEFVLKNIDAVVTPNLTQPLLGMNVLKRYKLAQDQGELVISER